MLRKVKSYTIKIPKRFVGYNYAYGLKIDSSDLTFAIHERHKLVYEYISRNNVINRRLTISYDANDFNSNKDLTYHIYAVRIGNKNLLEFKESRETDKFGLIIFLAADIFIIWMIIFAYKKKQQSTTTKCSRGRNCPT